MNPEARTNPSSPIAGMPILDVDKSTSVIVIKRSLSPGFAGIPNPLFAGDNTLMLFGVVTWSAVYVTPTGPTLWSNILSEVVFGITFSVAALVGSLILLVGPQDVDATGT